MYRTNEFRAIYCLHWVFPTILFCSHHRVLFCTLFVCASNMLHNIAQCAIRTTTPAYHYDYNFLMQHKRTTHTHPNSHRTLCVTFSEDSQHRQHDSKPERRPHQQLANLLRWERFDPVTTFRTHVKNYNAMHILPTPSKMRSSMQYLYPTKATTQYHFATCLIYNVISESRAVCGCADCITPDTKPMHIRHTAENNNNAMRIFRTFRMRGNVGDKRIAIEETVPLVTWSDDLCAWEFTSTSIIEHLKQHVSEPLRVFYNCSQRHNINVKRAVCLGIVDWCTESG